MEPKDFGEVVSQIGSILVVLDQVTLLFLLPGWKNLFSRHCSLGRAELRRIVIVTVIYLIITFVAMILMMVGYFV